MCRLFGLRANKPVDLQFSLDTGAKTIRHLSAKNPDGWGMGWYENGEACRHRETIQAAESSTFRQMAQRRLSAISIVHVRTRSVKNQRPTESDCHPFAHGKKWLFAHNGTLNNHGNLREELNESHAKAIEGATDSEVYFHWILQNIAQHNGSVEDGLRAALPRVKAKTGLNFLLSDGESLFAYRNAAKTPEDYSLFYLRRDPGSAGVDEMHSKLGALIRLKRRRGETAILVCSERLTDEGWSGIEMGSLLVVDEKLKYRIEEIS